MVMEADLRLLGSLAKPRQSPHTSRATRMAMGTKAREKRQLRVNTKGMSVRKCQQEVRRNRRRVAARPNPSLGL